MNPAILLAAAAFVLSFPVLAEINDAEAGKLAAAMMKFKTASGAAQDAEFKSAVQKANAKIKEHLQMARDVAGAAAGGSAPAAAGGK